MKATPPSLFLARPRPFDGESLSSWRQRSGMANGYWVYPMAPGELRRIDPDLAPSDITIAWLSESFGISPAEIERMTLRSLDRRCLAFGVGRAVPRWVLPLHYSRRERSFGLPHCVRCLQEDQQPFFRLAWRLAYFSACERHRVLYNDRCERCGEPAWPGLACVQGVFEGSRSAVHECPVCQFDFRKAGAHCVEELGACRLAAEFYDGSAVRVSAELYAPVSEYSAALWSITQLFLRTRSQRRILRVASAEARMVEAIRELKARSIESLPMRLRHALTSTAHCLLQSWPAAFVEFCFQHDVSAEHFSPDRESMPPWFHTAIMISLRRQVRGISVQQIDAARDSLIGEGKRVSKAALGRIVGGMDGKLLQSTFSRRIRATDAECLQFLGRLEACIQEPAIRRSSAEMRARDALVVLLAMLSNKTLVQVISMTREMVDNEVRSLMTCRTKRMGSDLAMNCLSSAHLRYTEARRTLSRKRRPDGDSNFFVGFGGGKAPARSAQKLIRFCMSELDTRLVRGPLCFSHVDSIT